MSNNTIRYYILFIIIIKYSFSNDALIEIYIHLEMSTLQISVQNNRILLAQIFLFSFKNLKTSQPSIYKNIYECSIKLNLCLRCVGNNIKHTYMVYVYVPDIQ